MTTYTSSLRAAALALPGMTPAQQAEAWSALLKIADTATKKLMADVAHKIVGAPTTDNNPKPPPFGAAALSAAVVDERRALLRDYFGLEIPAGGAV